MVKFTSKQKLKKVGKQMENNKLKICSFYVSDWHLTAMLLPFIEEKTEEGKVINTILEKNITQNMQEILSRIQINERIKEEILKIDWKNKSLIKYGEIKKFMEKATKNQKEVTIIIEGNKDRIDYINKNPGICIFYGCFHFVGGTGFQERNHIIF